MLLKKEVEVINKYKDGKIDKNTAIKRIFNINNSYSKCSSISEYHHLTEDEKINNILKGIRKKKKSEKPFDILDIDCYDTIPKLNGKKGENNKLINTKKAEFKSLLDGFRGVRNIRPAHLNHKNIISIFDSNLTRTANMENFVLSDNLIVVRVYYFKVAKDITLNGFMCNGEKYIYLTSSAGQIRTKKMVFIKESVWNQHKNTIMCGLSIEKINEKGGINGNKFLAYLALCNSATDVWNDFDMRKAIVVNDIETMVNGEVDFFDDKTYEITRKIMDIPIVHTDGCGMILPSLCNKNRMIRPPMIKGLLSPFDFREFIKQNNGNSKIKDIYGKEYDIFKDDIQVIFTKSQFKMSKFYSSWQEYIDCYYKYNCTTGYCNEEPEYISKSKLTYQMLQTLTDVTDEELKTLAMKTNDTVKKLSTDIYTVMEVFGADNVDDNSTYLQQAINLYPEIIDDIYTKEKLKTLKASIIKGARAGKLDLDAKYSFVIPDLYAFCEYLFLGNKNPNGLLNNGEVFCSLFDNDKELDCLRSPHLDNAHAIRINTINEHKKKWYITKGIYTSVKDLISKMLQFDNDGDQLLISENELLVKIARRNTKGDVPMYYHMAQAKAEIIDNEKLFDGLVLAFTSGNIGVPSNDISKEWNNDDIDLQLVKILCAEVNFVIDYAKTLYKPNRPDHINQRIKKLAKKKVPFFFKFAKDKTAKQVEIINNSTVNRLHKIIKSTKTIFHFENEDFDYRMLMKDRSINILEHDNICRLYDFFKYTTYNTSANTEKALEKRTANFQHKREQFLKYFKNINVVADVLVKYLYQDGINSKQKDVLWYCFGDVLVENLKFNLDNKYLDCNRCNKKFYAEYHNQRLCKKCSVYVPQETKVLACVNCGEEFEVDSLDRKKTMCSGCYKNYRKKYKAEKEKERRKKLSVDSAIPK